MAKRDLISKQKQCVCLFSLISILILLSATSPVMAEDNEHELSIYKPNKRATSGPYCGLYCVYTIMKTMGKDIDFGNLLKPEYIGSRKGSSLAELRRAVEDHGLYAG